jgi:hypothetical protein
VAVVVVVVAVVALAAVVEGSGRGPYPFMFVLVLRRQWKLRRWWRVVVVGSAETFMLVLVLSGGRGGCLSVSPGCLARISRVTSHSGT